MTKTVLFLTVLITILFNCTEEKNALSNYLDHVELQCESEQIENIRTALHDAWILSSEELESKRYDDYAGTPGQWDLRTLFEKHFVPDDPGKTLGENFYEEIKTEKVQNTIQQIVEQLKTIE